MKDVLRRAALLLMLAFAPLSAQAERWADEADVVFLGEQHDNPAHHARQAQIVRALSPAALVFEMLTPSQAGRVTPDLIAEAEALARTLDWDASGWPDFTMYHPIFAAAAKAQIYGAGIPREQARAALEADLAKVFGPGADRYGLTRPLPVAQQRDREALQMAAHCGALPQDRLPGMVNIQRLRDAALARAALEAFEATGGPVAVITGNGHARADWGAPQLLKMAAPSLRVVTLGQGEAGGPAPEGLFDRVEFAAPAEREDPCAAFGKA